jgi:hypothetical protein
VTTQEFLSPGGCSSWPPTCVGTVRRRPAVSSTCPRVGERQQYPFEPVTDYHNGGTSASPDEGTFAISGMSSVLAGPPSILDGAPTLELCRHCPDSVPVLAVGTSTTPKPSSFLMAVSLDTASTAATLKGSNPQGRVLTVSA